MKGRTAEWRADLRVRRFALCPPPSALNSLGSIPLSRLFPAPAYNDRMSPVSYSFLLAALLAVPIAACAAAAPVVSEYQGDFVGTFAIPLRQVEGTVTSAPVAPGSMSIRFQFPDSGDARALFFDQGDGRLVGLGLGAAAAQAGTGWVEYASGRWAVDIAPTGLVGAFAVYADVRSDSAAPPEFTELAAAEFASDAYPLLKTGGGLSHVDLFPGGLTLIARRRSDDAVMGLFYDTGSGRLTGATFLNRVLPEFATGRVNYSNGAWVLDFPAPGLSEPVDFYAVYDAGDLTPAAIWDPAGAADLAPGDLLLKIGGLLPQSHLAPGTLTLFLRSRVTGRLLGVVEDDGSGALTGTFLFGGMMSLPVSGRLVVSTGAWFADLAMPGSDQALDLFASYRYASYGVPRALANSPSVLFAADADPVRDLAGRVTGKPLRPGSVVGWIFREPDRRLVGAFRDLGDGRLQGVSLYQGVVPVSILGTIDYVSSDWQATLTFPGWTGSGTVWVCAQPLNGSQLPWDFAGDGRSERVVFSDGRWSAQTAGGVDLFRDVAWGWSGSAAVWGDYNGDGRNDFTVYDLAAGDWYVRAATGAVFVWRMNWGFPDAQPVPGDYDGDGRADFAVFGGPAACWYIASATGGGIMDGWAVQWGWPGALPVPGDYDGDGRFDQAVFDARGGHWFVRSTQGTVLSWNRQWGWPGARPVPGDYDADGRWDLGVFDDLGGRWFIQSMDGALLAWDVQWGWPGAVPVTGDFDGDGAFDLAVYHPDTRRWFVRSLTQGVLVWDE